MRNLIIGLILSCLVGCASNRYYVREDGRQTVFLEQGSRRVHLYETAYVTNYEELRALPHRGNLEYVGTKDGYHIVHWWEKISPGPSAVFVFAIPKDQFTPARPFKFDGMRSYTPSQGLFGL